MIAISIHISILLNLKKKKLEKEKFHLSAINKLPHLQNAKPMDQFPQTRPKISNIPQNYQIKGKKKKKKKKDFTFVLKSEAIATKIKNPHPKWNKENKNLKKK